MRRRSVGVCPVPAQAAAGADCFAAAGDRACCRQPLGAGVQRGDGAVLPRREERFDILQRLAEEGQLQLLHGVTAVVALQI